MGLSIHPPGLRLFAACAASIAALAFPASALALANAPAPAAVAAAAPLDMLPVLLALVLVLLGARLGGALSEQLGQPPVLGELLAGVVLGNLGLLGWHGLEPLPKMPALEILAQIGVLFLLFEVGLSSDAGRLLAVGGSALLVATLGVAVPVVLGFAVSRYFFPGLHPLGHWFVGATLCATSVGITARVLRDLGLTDCREGRIILGAAVIDDVMGLVVLAVLTGITSALARGVPFHPLSGLVILGKAIGFLGLAFAIGRLAARRMFSWATRLRGAGVLLSLALLFCFGMAWLAGILGLAPIVGAFSAGLVLDESHYRDLRARDPAGRDIPDLLAPLSTFLVPVFFVVLGMRVDLTVFGAQATLLFALALIVVAALSKQACSLGVLERDTDRLAVGVGMIPRGEVGLIFASLGTTLMVGGQHLLDATMFSAIVAMVAVTTLLTPPLLAWRLRRLPKP